MVTLLILDGFGLSDKTKGNAIRLAGTPNLDKLNIYPHATLCASGECVGLEKGQMGNSEVGHLNLGAGRIVYQDLPRINNAMKDGTFFENKAFKEVINHVLSHNSTLHLMGLASDGGVHSHIEHLVALVDMANRAGVNNICIHCFMDGRDTLRDSGKSFVMYLQQKIASKAQISSLCGRVYAMDREKRWDRVEKAYDMLALGHAQNYYMSATLALDESYKQGVFDEFVEPTIIGKAQTIDSFDGVIYFNFRTDRARELTQAFTDPNFDKFQTKHIHDLKFCTMTEYDDTFKNVIVAFPPEKIEDNLSAIISNHNLKQFHISETTKYAHVTFFFNGGIEKPYEGEDRKLIESENVQDFSLTPKMKAFEITDEVLSAIASKKYDFILVNLSNADMLGHTGNIEATKQTITAIDKCAYAIALASLMADGDLIITADHGNAETMLDDEGNTITSHTTNPVPIRLVSERYKDVKLKDGKLCNVAPTILKLLNINIPNNMSEPLF